MLYKAKESVTKDYDVIVVGSGLAGMTAANKMAKDGMKVLLLEAKIPTGIPMTIQKKTAVKIIANVVMLSDQRSTKSINTRLIKVNTANFNPLVLNDKNTNIKITIGKGIKFKIDSKPFRTPSIGADNFLKSGLCAKSHSLAFPSIHSPIGMYIS